MIHLSRRHFLNNAGFGFAGLALADLLKNETTATSPGPKKIDPLSPLIERTPEFTPKAERVIFLFQYGGPSTFDLLDYKPALQRLHGQPVPPSFKEHKDKVGGVFNNCKDDIMAGPWKWKRHGASGRWFSDLLPHTARHADDLCIVRSMTSDSSNHAPATYLMNTGAIQSGRPSLGSWVTYGLGSPNQNLPGYVLLYQVGGLGGSANWSNGFLPAAFQGTKFRHEGSPVLNLSPPESFSSVQRSTLDFTQTLNRKHASERPLTTDLEGRMASYELAYRMQSEAMDIGELSRETRTTREAYGIDDKNEAKAKFGRMCLLSRRLVEKGVRFVQVYNAVDKLGWDGHGSSHEFHRRNAAQTDQATAALLADLKQRGMLDSTLVIWAGEFGRTPMRQGKDGRNHNPYGFNVWFAGGGVNAGNSIGATDEIGLRAVDQVQTPKNFHATILSLLGLNPDELFFENHGRQERLTGVAKSWQVIPGVLG